MNFLGKTGFNLEKIQKHVRNITFKFNEKHMAMKR